MALPFMIRRVELRNYRSIEHCDVELGPLMFLVGPNASGKSNFLDALRFVADCLNTSVADAIRERGGFRSIFRRSDDISGSFSIKLTLELEAHGVAEYVVEIASSSDHSFEIRREACTVVESPGSEPFTFERPGKKAGSVKVSRQSAWMGLPVIPDRLFLKSAGISTTDPFYAVYRALSSMAFYNPSPAPMRDYQDPDSGGRLNTDASNAASVFRMMRESHPGWAERVFEYLSVAIPRLRKVFDSDVGEKVTFQFTEAARNGQAERTFYASSMSDGTLRMLAILLALLQRSERVSLVGIEEPEMGLHPGGTAVLFDCLNEASVSRQVIVTSHSSDLLDRDDVEIDSLLAVSADEGCTRIGPIDERQKSILRKKLGTAGDLLRREMLSPQPAASPIHS